MVRIAPVKLEYNPKTLWFDPGDLELEDGDAVVVKTERGTEFGHTCGIIEVEEEDLKRLRSKLKPVVRKATQDDLDKIADLRRQGEEALPVFKEMAAETNADMHPVMVEYLFDGEKAVFFFEAEERIDFRDLVRKLASRFHVRIDMRQIGVRDEARLVGGLGHCGQELCCKRMGGDFNPVSIRMAKEQDLSLNPQKISGVCGRLMCCLRYEYDAYKDFKSRAPKVNAKISTPDGSAKVCDLDVPRENVTVRMEDDGKKVTFPLSAMDDAEEGVRPNSIGDAFGEYANPDSFANGGPMGTFDTAGFTRDDKLGTPEAKHNPQRSNKKGSDGDKQEGNGGNGRKPRRRRNSGQSKNGGQDSRSGSGSSQRQSKGKQEGSKQQESSKRQNSRGASQSQNRQNQNSNRKNQGSQGKSAVRPGQKSSGLQKNRQDNTAKPARDNSAARPTRDASVNDTHRKNRRRSHKTGGDSNEV